MALSKITAEQLYENGVVSAPDTLVGSPTENKKVFDKMITQLVAPAYNACVDVVNELVRKEQEVASSEAARAAAETERQGAETERQGAETERQGAEMERRREEEARAESETKRVADETKRVADETKRVEAETLREKNEAERVSAEIGRGSMENDRMGAEQSRLQAEEERENAEHDRTIAEGKRAEAETARSVWENYSASKNYVPGNKVSYGGSSYLNTKACSGVMPTNGSYWLLIAAKGDTGPQGVQGNQGGVFVPIIDEDGTLSWTRDGGVDADAPDPVNIKGPPGNGDMNKNDYDPHGEVSEMGGIPEFFSARMEDQLENIDPEGAVREVGGVAAYVDNAISNFTGTNEAAAQAEAARAAAAQSATQAAASASTAQSAASKAHSDVEAIQDTIDEFMDSGIEEAASAAREEVDRILAELEPPIDEAIGYANDAAASADRAYREAERAEAAASSSASKAYVDAELEKKLDKTGGTMISEDEEYETTLAPEKISLENADSSTNEITATGIQLSEDGEEGKLITKLKLGELSFYHSLEDGEIVSGVVRGLAETTDETAAVPYGQMKQYVAENGGVSQEYVDAELAKKLDKVGGTMTDEEGFFRADIAPDSIQFEDTDFYQSSKLGAMSLDFRYTEEGEGRVLGGGTINGLAEATQDHQAVPYGQMMEKSNDVLTYVFSLGVDLDTIADCINRRALNMPMGDKSYGGFSAFYNRKAVDSSVSAYDLELPLLEAARKGEASVLAFAIPHPMKADKRVCLRVDEIQPTTGVVKCSYYDRDNDAYLKFEYSPGMLLTYWYEEPKYHIGAVEMGDTGTVVAADNARRLTSLSATDGTQIESIKTIGKNFFKCNRTTPLTHIGVTATWDAENQEFILNGTTTSAGDLKLVDPMPLDWVAGEKYAVSVRHVGGTATLASGAATTTYSWGIFQNNAAKYVRGSVSNTSFVENYTFTATAFALDTSKHYIFYFQCWRPGTVFDNYRVKVQIERGTSVTGWEAYREESVNGDISFDNSYQAPALQMHKGQNNVMTTPRTEIAVKYIVDNKDYIDSKFAAVEAAIISMGGNA